MSPDFLPDRELTEYSATSCKSSDFHSFRNPCSRLPAGSNVFAPDGRHMDCWCRHCQRNAYSVSFLRWTNANQLKEEEQCKLYQFEQQHWCWSCTKRDHPGRAGSRMDNQWRSLAAQCWWRRWRVANFATLQFIDSLVPSAGRWDSMARFHQLVEWGWMQLAWYWL